VCGSGSAPIVAQVSKPLGPHNDKAES